MTSPWGFALVLLLLPIAVVFAGGWLMSWMSGRVIPARQTPLFRRHGGYDVKAVAAYWGGLDQSGTDRRALHAEQRFLELDLVFPTLYGTAFIVSLWTASDRLNLLAYLWWILAPVTIAVFADWTENLVQLDQLRNFLASKSAGLLESRIRVASRATVVKLAFVYFSFLELAALLAAMVL